MAYFDGAKSSKGWYARLEYSYTQSSSATTITLTLKVYDATGSSYNTSTNEAYYIIQGTKTYKTYSFNSAGWYTIGSKTVTVSDTSATSLNVSAMWCSENETTYTPYSLSVSGTVTFPQIKPDTIPIYVTDIQSDIYFYEGGTFSLTVTPSGGSSYSYAWYRDGSLISSYQTFTRSNVSRSLYDNTKVWCVVTEKTTGVTATTNQCWFHVGLKSALTTVTTNQIQPVKIYSSSKFNYAIPWVYDGTSWKYACWNVTYTKSNRADIVIADNAIVG